MKSWLRAHGGNDLGSRLDAEPHRRGLARILGGRPSACPPDSLRTVPGGSEGCHGRQDRRAKRAGQRHLETSFCRVVFVGCAVACALAGMERVWPDDPPRPEEPSGGPSETAPAAPGHFTPLAQQFLDEAKQRLGEQRNQELQRRLGRERQEAQRLAVQRGRERLRQQASQERQAQRQVELARERQLKALYAKAASLYQRGSYQEAIALLQQMALMDPSHPLVKAAERLITRAELKHLEERVRVGANLAPERRGAIVPELEQLLTHKRMELETVLKYAKSAVEDRDHDMALKLLTAILAQDPSHREAQHLMERVQLATLREEREQAVRQVQRDEQAMINDVLKAQALPQARGLPRSAAPRPLTATPRSAMEGKLRQRISFDFNDVALSDVLDFIADAANVSMIPSPQVDLKSRRVSLKAAHLPLDQAMKYLMRSLSLAYHVEEDAILIATPDEFSNEALETRVFFLRKGLGPLALETSAIEPNPALAMEPIKELIRRTVPQPPESKLVVDERSGALVVSNTPENLALVERLLSQLDVTPLQVLIEARFIELTMTELEHLGLESVLTGGAALAKQRAADGSRGPAHEIASGGGMKFASLAREAEGLNLTLQGILTGTQFEAVLHLLEESKKSKTLSAPSVTTLNNQTALIRVVDEFRYPTRYEVSLIQFDINGDGDFDDAGETEFANVPQDFQQRDIGILLNVTPSVGRDLRTITLVLAPEVSQFSQFRSLGGGVTVPEFTSSQLTTSIVIQDGQTVMLGGLMKDVTSQQVTRVPLLGSIPVLGALFRQQEESTTRKNLLIFITARLLAPRGPTT